MSIHDDADAGRTPSRTHVVLLADVLDQTRDSSALRCAILEGASTEKYRLYWPVPSDRMAFSGPGESFASEYKKLMSFLDERTPSSWIPRPNVRFVRLSSKVTQQFLAMKSHIHGPISEFDFPDGLLIPNDVSVSSGLLEVTAFSARLRLSYPARLDGVSDRGTQSSTVEIRFHEIYIDEGTHDHIEAHLQDLPSAPPAMHTATAAQDTVATAAITEHATTAPSDTDTTSATTNEAPGVKSVRSGDPYELKGRADGVYALYQTAERCASNPSFGNASKVRERRNIALETFNQLLDEMAKGSDDENARQKQLRRFFGETRLNYALRLIDPEFDHNDGRPPNQRCEWPPALGKKFLAQPDERRQTFVKDMLALIIGGVNQWFDFNTKLPAKGKTKQEALQQWLEDRGLTGSQELKTAFAVIAWSGRNDIIPTPPKYA